MPVIDVSQKSFRTLVQAAHKHGMSVDRFIQYRFAPKTDEPDMNDATAPREVATAEFSATPARVHTDRSVSKVAAERKQTRVSRLPKMDSSFEALWERIEENAGVEISTKRGLGFTYGVEAGYLTVRESGARIPRSQFKKALGQWPASGPSTMRGIYAASVVWAVLADRLAPGVRGASGRH